MSLLADLKATITEGLKSKTLTSCSRWAEHRRVMGAPFEGNYSFLRHPWCRAIHDSKAAWTMATKAAQSGVTETGINRAFYTLDQAYFLPTISVQRYRYLWIDPATGQVNLQFYNLEGTPVDQFGTPSGPIVLELNRIPFVMLDIGGSLIKDVAQHQIALLNLGSSDVAYALRSNFPFYVEQKDLRAVGSHLKNAATADGTATTGGQGAGETDIKAGATHGRAYDKGMQQPAFINPSAEPLRASLELQDRLKRDIRELVNLAVSALAVRASAESKAMDNQGLEAGLSYIGLLDSGGRSPSFGPPTKNASPARAESPRAISAAVTGDGTKGVHHAKPLHAVSASGESRYPRCFAPLFRTSCGTNTLSLTSASNTLRLAWVDFTPALVKIPVFVSPSGNWLAALSNFCRVVPAFFSARAS
jgi:hypothetical protein